MPGDRWALVGPNGAGKSTLLRALLGDDVVRLSSGRVTVMRNCNVGYLEQTAVSGSQKTVKEEVTSRMGRIVEARSEMERAEKAVEGGDYSEEALQVTVPTLSPIPAHPKPIPPSPRLPPTRTRPHPHLRHSRHWQTPRSVLSVLVGTR